MTPQDPKPDDSPANTRDVGSKSTPLHTRSKAKQREPPPVLFLHPSTGASHVSLPGILAPGAPVLGPLDTKREPLHFERSVSIRHGGAAAPSLQRAGRDLRTAESTRSADRTDALWAEMQATLEDVESSASGSTHVFGPEHDRKLGDLRTAQIALAQAWARSEADETIESALHDDNARAPGDEVKNFKGAWEDTGRHGVGDGPNAAKSVPRTNNKRPGSSSAGVTDRLAATTGDDTELDIRLASKRREANDAYFQRVNDGVIDVVTKLEDVAVAMRAVEQESKDVWDERNSLSDVEM